MPIIKKSDFIEAKGIIDDLRAVQKELGLTTKEVVNLQTATRQVNKEGSGSEAKSRIDLTKQLNAQTVKLESLREKEAKQLVELKVKQQELNKKLKEEVKEELQLTTAYDKLAKQRTIAQKELKKNIVLYGEQSKQVQKAQQEFNKLDKVFRSANKAARDGRPDVGRYTLALKNLGTQILGAAGLVGGTQLLVDGFKNFAENVNRGIEVTKKLTQSFSITNKVARDVSTNILAISDTFDQDYNEVLQSAISVSKQMGITVDEATNLIEEGFLKGSNNSGEFLDILKEYPTQFKAAGINAEQAFAIINQQVTEGIYSDKGVDAIKEAGLRLRENTKAVKAALAPLDESIKKQIEQEIAAGNSFEAIKLVSKALNDTSLTAQQTQTIIADVFGGPGEDAGLKYLQSLKDIKTNLKDVAIQSTQSEQATLNLSKAWNGLSNEVGASEGIFTAIGTFFKNFITVATNQITALIDKIRNSRLGEWLGVADNQAKGLNKTLDFTPKKIRGVTDETDKNTISLKNNNDKLKNNNKSREKALKLTKDQTDALSLLNGELEKQRQIQRTGVVDSFLPDSIQTTRGLNIPQQTQGKSLDQGAGTTQFNAADEAVKLTEILKKEEETRTENEADEILKRQELERDFYDGLVQLAFNTLDQIGSAATDQIDTQLQYRQERIQENADAEKAILQDQLEKGLITEKQFKEKTAEIDKKARKESAKAEKEAALFKIAIDTAVGIVKALGSSGPPLNFINAALVAAAGIVQAALVSSQPEPQFAEGVIGFQGKGTETSDSNRVRISKNESIITAQGTHNAPITLDMINKGMLTDADLIGGKQLAPVYNNDYSKLLSEQQKTNILLSNMGWQFTSNGITTIQRADGSIIKDYK